MTLEETVTLWETEYNELVRIMRAHQSDEYKLGFTDGLETAVEALRTYINETPR